MLLDAAALGLLGVAAAFDGRRPRIPALLFSTGAATALLLLWAQSGMPPGFGVLVLLSYGLARALTAMTGGNMAAAPLLAGLSAGLLTYSGPFGVLAAATAVAGYGLLGAASSKGRSLVAASVLLFVPLTVLAAFASAALIETGILHSIEAGRAVFLRGMPPAPVAMLFCMPLLLPLARAAFPRLRRETIGPLAMGAGGVIAGIALDSTASFWPCALAAGLAAAGARSGAFLIVLALSGASLAVPALRESGAVPLIAPWRIAAERPQALPAWGIGDAAVSAPRHALPHLDFVDGHYVLGPGRRAP